jgi:hypothetical protein
MIKYDLVFFFIESQFEINAIGIIIAVNNTKYKDIVSIPKCILNICIFKSSSGNCNSLLLKLKRKNRIMTIPKLNIEENKATYLE